MSIGIVTGSEVRTFRSCRRKWDFAYRQLLRRKGGGASPLVIGSLVHDGIDAHYKGRFPHEIGNLITAKALDAAEKSTEAERQSIMDELPLIKGMVMGFAETFHEEDSKFKHVSSEREFIVPLGAGLPMLAGKMDGIQQSRTDRFWLAEHKTASQIGEDYFRMLDIDIQHPSYLWGGSKYFEIKFEGVIYNVLRKSLPKRPEWLEKSKRLSTAMKDNVTYGSFLAEIRDRFLAESDYAEHLEKLKAQENRFFYRRYLFANEDRIESIMDEFRMTVKDMIDPEVVTYGNPNTMTCRGCPFFAICAVWHDKKEVAETIDMFYERKDSPHEELELPF